MAQQFYTYGNLIRGIRDTALKSPWFKSVYTNTFDLKSDMHINYPVLCITPLDGTIAEEGNAKSYYITYNINLLYAEKMLHPHIAAPSTGREQDNTLDIHSRAGVALNSLINAYTLGLDGATKGFIFTGASLTFFMHQMSDECAGAVMTASFKTLLDECSDSEGYEDE